MTTTVLPLPPDLAKSETLRPLLQGASAWVDDLVSAWPMPLTVEWYRVTDGPFDDLVGVRISSENATAHGVLSAAQLADPTAYRQRLARVFDAMLNNSINEHHRRYKQLVSTGVEE